MGGQQETLPYLQSSQVAYRKERLRWLSAGGRTWGRGGLELCSQATHTPALGKVVLWAVGSKLARGAFPAQVSPHVGSYQVPGPSGQTPKLGAAMGGGQAGSRVQIWPQHLDLEADCLCARRPVCYTFSFPYRNGRVETSSEGSAGSRAV